MSYRRRFSYHDRGSYPTKVTIHWSNSYGAYAIKWHDTHHWNEMQVFISYLNKLPYGERDYDPDNKIWYLAEKHIEAFMEMMKLMPSTIFDHDFQKKPEGQAFQTTFVPIDVYLDKFRELSGHELRGKEYDDAKKIYRRTALTYHPDRNGGDGSKMSEVNEAWGHIEQLYFHIKKEVEYENASVDSQV